MRTQMMQQQKSEKQVPAGQERTHTRRVYQPAVDIHETDAELVLRANMPGVDNRGVDIILEDDALTVRGRAAEAGEESRSLTYAEYGVGDFERTFVLSAEVDRDRIEASIKNGVLTLRLPKAAAARARKIAVKAA